MAVTTTSRDLLSLLVIFGVLSSLSWASFINRRHSIHLSVNEPDDARFKLDNMERIANEMIAARREGRAMRHGYDNPYATRPHCDPSWVYRTMDGTCNNVGQPWMGAAKTPLIRMSQHTYEDGFNAPRLTYYKTDNVLPSPRRVSVSVHLTTSNISTVHTHLLMNWGQFMDHDITLSPESGGEGGAEANKTQCCEASPNAFKDNLRECFPISTSNDPVYRRTHCIAFLRSAPIPGLPHLPHMRYQMNDLSSYIDGSMIYGSTKIKGESLRLHRGGLLRSNIVRNEERLPDEEDNPRDCYSGENECRFASGDVRNSEQAALTSIHTLMMRAHNRMARELERLNPYWDDEKLYQTARKIMGAMIQRITYNEFLPLVLGPKYMRKYGLEVYDTGRFMRYSPNEDCSVMTEFSTAAFRFGHSLIRQTFSHSGRSLDVKDIFDAYKTTDRLGTDGMLKGVIHDTIESCERFVTRGVRDNLFGEDMDLMSFNIQRGRDHGLGSYADIRRTLGMHMHTGWDAMAGDTHSHTTVNDMKKVYPDPEDIEAFPGGMSESPVANGLVGDTFANIIGMQFKKLRYGDRFWHETPDQKVGFNDAQLAEIRKSTLAMLFCDNVPGINARQWLLTVESHSNPRIHCRDIGQIDLTYWQESGQARSAPIPTYRPPQTHRTYRPPTHGPETYRTQRAPTHPPQTYRTQRAPTHPPRSYRPRTQRPRTRRPRTYRPRTQRPSRRPFSTRRPRFRTTQRNRFRTTRVHYTTAFPFRNTFGQRNGIGNGNGNSNFFSTSY